MTKAEELRKLQELRGLIIGVMIGNVDASVLASYSYSEADGTQSATRRNPLDLMKWLNEVDEMIDKLKRPAGGIRTFGTHRFGG